MVTTGIELASGQIAKMGRWRIEYVGFAGVDATYLHNGARRTFRPDATARYEVEVAA